MISVNSHYDLFYMQVLLVKNLEVSFFLLFKDFKEYLFPGNQVEK